MTGPPILLDKSAVECLAPDEINVLYRHYSPVVPPILVQEVLADLAKSNVPSGSLPYAAKLAEKLRPGYSLIHPEFGTLVRVSLMGQTVPMNGYPIMPQTRTERTPEGKVVGIVEQSPLAESLQKWRAGEFSDNDKQCARSWRDSIESLDMEGFRATLIPVSLPKEPKSIYELKRIMFGSQLRSMDQVDLLNFVLEALCKDHALNANIRARWAESNEPSLADFAPYAYYWLELVLLFMEGLERGLITTKRTNLLDLEYGYYVPFCKIFCSKDNFHKDLSSIVITRTQEYVDAGELKRDLRLLADHWSSQSPDVRQEYCNAYGDAPPKIPNSMTRQLWYRLGYNPDKRQSNAFSKMDREQQVALTERLRGILRESTPVTYHPDLIGEPEIIAVERTILASDPRPCGSGEPFYICHGREVAE